MIEKRMDRSRRTITRAAMGGVSAGLLLRVAQAKASEKMTRQQAEYQDTPNGIYSCATCTLFEQPNSCKVVERRGQQGWLVQGLRDRGLIYPPLEGEGRREAAGWGEGLSLRTVPELRDRHPTPSRILLRAMRAYPPPPGGR